MSALIPALIECFATGNCGLLGSRGRGGGGGGGGAAGGTPKPPPDPNAAWEKAAERSFTNQFDNQLNFGGDGYDPLKASRQRYEDLLKQLGSQEE